jgi:hypothetical protein
MEHTEALLLPSTDLLGVYFQEAVEEGAGCCQ